jgi:hypothetical protein
VETARRAASHLVIPLGTLPVIMELDLSSRMNMFGVSHWAEARCGQRIAAVAATRSVARVLVMGDLPFAAPDESRRFRADYGAAMLTV